MHDKALASLFARLRSGIDPDKHPRTAAALDELRIAVTLWADQSPAMPGQTILIILIAFIIIVFVFVY